MPRLASRSAALLPVAGLAAQGQRLLQVAGGILVPALPQLDLTEVAESVRLTGSVTEFTEQAKG